MSYLLAFHAGWLFAALILGGVLGWVTWQRVRAAWIDGLVRLALATVALLAIVAILKLIPGRPGYWLDLALLMIWFYGLGCVLGWLMRDLGTIEATPAETDRPIYMGRLGPGPWNTPRRGEAVPPRAGAPRVAGGPIVPSLNYLVAGARTRTPHRDVASSADGAAPPVHAAPPPAAAPPHASEAAPSPGQAPGGLAATSVEAAPVPPAAFHPPLLAASGAQPAAAQSAHTETAPAAGPPTDHEPGVQPDVSTPPTALVAPALNAPSPMSTPTPAQHEASTSISNEPMSISTPVATDRVAGVASPEGSHEPDEPQPSSQILPVSAPTARREPDAGIAPEPAPAPPVPNEDKHPGARPAGLVEPRGGTCDNLQRIKGIGPQNEGRLHALGIWHFAQIAAWTQENVIWVGSYLAFPGRIDREKWVEQATNLAAGGVSLKDRPVARSPFEPHR